MKKTIAVWFSCGATSAVAAKLTLEKYSKTHNVIILNNPVIEEDKDNQRFLKDVEKWLNVKIKKVINKKYPSCSAVDVWNDRKFMSGVHGAPCTLELKKQARFEYEKENEIDYYVLGYTYEEKDRHERFINSEMIPVLPVLIENKITKQNCFDIIQKAGIELPRVYKMGYPNANCIGCVKATSPTYWNHVREKHPEIFNQRAKQSREIGAKLVRVKGHRVFLDELHPKIKGRSMKNYNIECGLFCLADTEGGLEGQASNDR